MALQCQTLDLSSSITLKKKVLCHSTKHVWIAAECWLVLLNFGRKCIIRNLIQRLCKGPDYLYWQGALERWLCFHQTVTASLYVLPVVASCFSHWHFRRAVSVPWMGAQRWKQNRAAFLIPAQSILACSMLPFPQGFVRSVKCSWAGLKLSIWNCVCSVRGMSPLTVWVFTNGWNCCEAFLHGPAYGQLKLCTEGVPVVLVTAFTFSCWTASWCQAFCHDPRTQTASETPPGKLAGTLYIWVCYWLCLS